MIDQLQRRIKNFIQRGQRGYSDEDLWGLDGYLAKMLPKAFRQLAKHKIGCPAEFFDEAAVGNECHRWQEELEKMAQGFDSARHIIDNDSFVPSARRKTEPKYIHFKENEEAHYERLRWSIEALKRNFFGLWD